MKNIYRIVLLNILFSSTILFAQSKKPISVAQSVPDFAMQMVNYKTNTAKLSDFKGKLIVLDFWATWCSACINHFALNDTLQRKYQDKLQIILVNAKATKDTREKIEKFFKLWQKRTGSSLILPTAVNDVYANNLFVHKLIPHYVWIGTDGKLLAIANSADLTDENIKKAIMKEKVNFHEKKDIVNYDNEKPLLEGNGGDNSKIIYRSMITGYLDGIPTGISASHPGKVPVKISATNEPILRLYQIAYQTFFPNNRILLQIKNPEKVTNSKDWALWKYDNTFCYELIKPINIGGDIYKRMQNDLVDFFGYSVTIERRKIKCYVLTKSTSSFTDIKEDVINNSKFKLWPNVTIADLVSVLNRDCPVPLIDECKFDAPMSINLPVDHSDIKTLQQSLKAHGVDIFPEEREMEVFILGDIKVQ